MNRYSILIVEDNENLLRELRETLENEGYQADIASNGKTALQLWKERLYDLILVDLRIPEIDGRDLIDVIKEKQPLTQIVILSGEGERDDLIDAINRRVYAYLLKPVDLERILETVADALKNRDPILLSLERWAEIRPDEAVITTGEREISVRDLYNEVRRGGEFGKAYLEEYKRSLTEFRAPKKSIDDLLGVKGVMV